MHLLPLVFFLSIFVRFINQTETIIIIASSVVAGVIIIVAIGAFIFVRYCLGGRGNNNKGKDISRKDEQNPFDYVKPQADYGTNTTKIDTIAIQRAINNIYIYAKSYYSKSNFINFYKDIFFNLIFHILT